MKKEKAIRSKWLTIRLTDAESRQLEKYYSKTTSKSLSEYGRAVLLREPVTVLYRNQTADDFLNEMLQLKNELNAIGNNFNQVVHRLHTLDHVPEIKAWAVLNETAKQSFQFKVSEICDRLNQIYDLWSQK